MTAMQRRFKNVLQRIGDTFTVSGNSRKGVFAVLPLERAMDFLTDSELGASTLPIRFAYVPYDDATGVSDSVNWDSQTLTVKKAVNVLAQSDVVARMLVLA